MTDKENGTANDAMPVTRTGVKHVAGSGRSTTIRRCAFTPRYDAPRPRPPPPHPFVSGSHGDKGRQLYLFTHYCPHSGLS